MCARFNAMDFRRFFSFKLTFVGFFQARAQSSLEKRNVLDRLLYYFNLKKKISFNSELVFKFFLWVIEASNLGLT